MNKNELIGMRFLLASQVMRLISEAFIIASFLFSLFSGSTLASVISDVSGNLHSFVVIMALDSLIFVTSLISVIINLIALIMLSRYERKFLPAIFTLIIGYAAAFVGYLPMGDMISDVIPVFNDVMLMVTTLTVMEGCLRLAYSINDQKLYSFGDLLVKLSAAGYVVNMLCSICTLIFSSSFSYDSVSTVFSSASIVLELAIYILYFVLILRTMNSLKHHTEKSVPTPSQTEEVGTETASA